MYILTLLQVCSISIEPRLPSPAAVVFNSPMRGLMPKPNKSPILFNHNDLYNDLIERQQNAEKSKDAHKSYLLISTKSTVAVKREDGSP